jgi:Phage integrase, N-terminal SAM-like domain
MGRRATGQVIRPDGHRRSFAIRFWAYGNRRVVTLGRPEDGWTSEMAERELAATLRDVELGIRRPVQPDRAPAIDPDPTFHRFASDWFDAKQLEIEENTRASYRNDLVNHLLPFFKDHHLSQITIAEVDRYRQHKLREAAEIRAAAEAGKPRMVVIVAVAATTVGSGHCRHGRSTCICSCWRRSSRSPSTTTTCRATRRTGSAGG